MCWQHRKTPGSQVLSSVCKSKEARSHRFSTPHELFSSCCHYSLLPTSTSDGFTLLYAQPVSSSFSLHRFYMICCIYLFILVWEPCLARVRIYSGSCALDSLLDGHRRSFMVLENKLNLALLHEKKTHCPLYSLSGCPCTVLLTPFIFSLGSLPEGLSQPLLALFYTKIISS